MQDFNFKIQAARYHLKQLKANYSPGKLRMSETNPGVANEFYYYADAFLFEASACFDVLMQSVNDRLALGFTLKQVDWTKTAFKEGLRSRNQALYGAIIDATSQPWFKALNEARNMTSHRGQIVFQAEIGPDETVTVLELAYSRPAPTGADLLRNPHLNRGSAFPLADRRAYCVEISSVESVLCFTAKFATPECYTRMRLPE